MTMENKIERVLMFICMFALCYAVWYFRGVATQKDVEVKTDTIYTERIDTMHITKEITRYRPTPTRVDTILIKDTLKQEMVQHIQKVYECDSSVVVDEPSANVDYHLYVKTDNYDVDSVALKFNVDYPKVTEIQTITKEITKTKTKHFGYGINVGVGYGLINRKPDVYVGFGVGYNF